MYFIPFETARLRLRPQEAKDAGFALCIWGDPITGKYLTDPALDTIDNLNEYMELLRHLNDSADCYYVIAEDKVTGQAIGTCCAVIKENGRCWDIGYCIILLAGERATPRKWSVHWSILASRTASRHFLPMSPLTMPVPAV